LPENCALADCKNMLYLGTDVTRGKGLGVVVGTGMNTEIGYLMTLMKTQEKTVTPLHEKVTGLANPLLN
jgi:magnesium-transporting ATPase (P-type)